MTILQIEHKVPNYEGWKKAFDNDPVDRKKSGVKKYQIYRPEEDSHYVIIDLYFDQPENAKKMLESLKALWGQVEGTVMSGAKTRIMEVAETMEL